MPYLNEEDISGVVCRLNRATEERRARLANDAHTRSFIAAGVSLIHRELGLVSAEDDSENEAERKHLKWLSQREVEREAKRIGQPTATMAKLRDRWPKHYDYIADLISYMLWSERLKLDESQAKLASDTIAVGDPADVVRQIHEVAYSDLTAMVATASFRFQLVAAATATNDPVIGDALRGMYLEILSSWTEAYQETIERLGLRLRPDVSIIDVANILAAVAEGLGVHMLADPRAENLKDDTRRTSLLGKTALAVLISCFTNSDDDRSLEDVARDMIRPARRRRLD